VQCRVRANTPAVALLSAVDGGGTTTHSSSRCSTVGNAHVQLLSVPQLDNIQRTLRILDVRLQHVQSNVKDDVTRHAVTSHT